MPEVGVSGTAAHFCAAHAEAVVLKLHHGRLFNGLCESRPAAAALKLIRGGKERFAGDDIHIDALLELIPERIAEWTFRAVLLGDVVLLHRQFVPNGLCCGLLVVARIDAKLGEQFHLRPRDVAIAVRILFQIILMVFLAG